MSLINQMLKDLDARRGPASGVQVAALQGVGLVDAKRLDWRAALRVAVLSGAALLTLAIGYQGVGWWLESRAQPLSAAAKPVAAQTEPGIARQVPAPVTTAEQQFAVAGSAAEAPHNQAVASAAADASQREPVRTSRAAAAAAPAAQAAQAARNADEEIHEAVTVTSVIPVASVETPNEKPAPVRTLSPRQKAQRIHARAQQALADGRLDTARGFLEQALIEDPLHVEARLQLATLLLTSGERAQAEELLATGVRLHPGRPGLARPYAQLLAERGASRQALTILDAAAQGQEEDAETLALRAAILYRAGRFGEASENYRRALQTQPGRGLWWVGLGVASENHDNAAALEAFRRAAELELEKGVRDYVEQRIATLASYYGSNGN